MLECVLCDSARARAALEWSNSWRVVRHGALFVFVRLAASVAEQASVSQVPSAIAYVGCMLDCICVDCTRELANTEATEGIDRVDSICTSSAASPAKLPKSRQHETVSHI
jgi:hypothetical protein